MKRLFAATSAIALLAALPVMAQNTMGAAPSAETGAKAKTGSNSGHAMTKHPARRGMTKTSDNAMTAQLNREEANRLQSGGQ
ncbi:MAG: hypothetical protein JWL84_473 [Rhodospirillales bacterium]|jgi:hypothetical protein|nr:hypothetical protein [Rhodospirillales bacterium]